MSGADESIRAPAAVHRAVLLLGLALAASAAVVLYLFDPATSPFWAPCPYHALTGLHCPGCGSVRAMHQLLHGNLLAALDYNPLTVLAVPFVGYAFFRHGLSVARKRPPPGASVRPFWLWLLLGAIIVFWIVRNIPVYPFTILAP